MKTWLAQMKTWLDYQSEDGHFSLQHRFRNGGRGLWFQPPQSGFLCMPWEPEKTCAGGIP
jgi:hypothetical protein